MQRQTVSRGGFTIIELLVIISIIVILLSMLLPSIGQTRTLTEKVTCANNLHQQGIGMGAFQVANRFYPGHCARSQNGHISAVWPTRIRLFAPDHNIFYCPSEPDGFQWQENTGSPGGVYATSQDAAKWAYEEGERLLVVGGPNGLPFSYGYNDWGRWNVLKNPQRGLGADLYWGGLAVPEVSTVTNPAGMIAISDNTTDGSWDYNIDPTNPREYPGRIHDDGSNVLFADGHVQWYSQDELVDVNLSTQAGRDMSRLWNNHNKDTADQN